MRLPVVGSRPGPQQTNRRRDTLPPPAWACWPLVGVEDDRRTPAAVVVDLVDVESDQVLGCARVDGLTLDDGTGPVTVTLGDGVWQRATATVGGRTVEVAGTGGWTSLGVLEARLVPVHSPHVLDATLDLGDGTAALTWQTSPLGAVSLARRAF